MTIGKGLTLDVGLRIEKESLPAPGGVKVSSIDFPWSDKIEPRLGAAWDPTRKGKMKIFGSYGIVNDVMKLLLAQTSWGAQASSSAAYPLDSDGTAAGFDISDMDIVFKADRACPNGVATTQANFANGVRTDLNDKGPKVSIIENVNYRPWEPVAPNVKPYRQHEYVAGLDYQISPHLALEARYDRRRLDHVIEDASLLTRYGARCMPWSTLVRASTTPSMIIHLPGWAWSGVRRPGTDVQRYRDFGSGAAFGTCPSLPANAQGRPQL